MNRLHFALLIVLCVVPVAADGEEPAVPTDEVLSADSRTLQRWSEVKLDTGAEVHHYDAQGFPEDDRGQLVLWDHSLGPMVFAEHEDDGRLLYAQFENRQRDAVLLARTGTLRDTRPDGTAFVVPYGYGALKQNEVVISLVEARAVPHVGDNQKRYRLFPLSDLYLGASVGSSGITGSLRYVLREAYVGYVRVGLNTFGRLNPRSVLNTYWIPVHVGGGYRFPGLFPELLGENMMTVGADALVGFGDRDGTAETAPFVLLPGAMLDIERVLYDTAHSKQDFRANPRPYNYRVNSLSVRIGAYLDVPTFKAGGSIVRFMISAGAQFNILGPKIPEHEFKTTHVRYVHEYYVEDLETQSERREARADS